MYTKFQGITIVDYQTAPLDNNNNCTVLGPVGPVGKKEKEDWRRHWRGPQGNKGLASSSSFDLAAAAGVPLSASASELESKRHPLAFVTLLPNTNSPGLNLNSVPTPTPYFAGSEYACVHLHFLLDFAALVQRTKLKEAFETLGDIVDENAEAGGVSVREPVALL